MMEQTWRFLYIYILSRKWWELWILSYFNAIDPLNSWLYERLYVWKASCVVHRTFGYCLGFMGSDGEDWKRMDAILWCETCDIINLHEASLNIITAYYCTFNKKYTEYKKYVYRPPWVSICLYICTYCRRPFYILFFFIKCTKLMCNNQGKCRYPINGSTTIQKTIQTFCWKLQLFNNFTE